MEISKYSTSIQSNEGTVVTLTSLLVLNLALRDKMHGGRRIYPQTFCKVFETRGITWNSMLGIFKFIHIMG